MAELGQRTAGCRAAAVLLCVLGAGLLVACLQSPDGWTREAEPVPFVRVGRAPAGSAPAALLASTARRSHSASLHATAASTRTHSHSASLHATAASNPSHSASLHATAASSRSHSASLDATATTSRSLSASRRAPVRRSRAAPPHASASHSPVATLVLGDDARRPFLADDTDAAAAAARRDTTACGETYYDSLVLHAPFHDCTSAQLYEAVSRGWRDAIDAPFHVRGCRVQWYSSSEACDLLMRAGSLIIRGDSLARHLTQALVTILVGDFAGATDLRRDTRDKGYHPCVCAGAYNDGHFAAFPGSFRTSKNRYCRDHSIAALPFKSRRGKSLYCPAWRESHLNTDRFSSGIVYVSGGLHFPNLNGTTLGALFGPDARLASVPQRPRAHFSRICGLMHAPGRNKPVAYLTSHGLSATLQFNAAVEHECRDDHVFNPFSVTRNATSIDGQHYPAAPNILLAQLLLNHVAAIVRES